MAYILTADIQSKFKKITFNTVSTITLTEIGDEITRTEAYVKGKISPFYNLTLITLADTPIAWAIIREICMLHAAGKVNEILRKNGVMLQEEAEKARIEAMISRAEKMLKGIALFAVSGNVEGALSLVDVTPYDLPTTNAATGQGTSVPEFKKDSIQW